MEKVDVLQPINSTLDGTKFVSWAQEMSSFLKGRRLWRYVIGDVTKPVQLKDEGIATYIDRLVVWDSKNHQILNWIRNTTITSYL